MKPLVIYHANCADGFGAAFAAWLKFGEEAEYLPMQYGSKSPTIKLSDGGENREVYILDFSFERLLMNFLFKHAKLVVWLDHHKSAFEMWCGPVGERTRWLEQNPPNHIDLNNNKSGAMLAWEYFHPDKEVPMLIKHIDDYDRWQFKIEGTKEFNKSLWSHAPWNFEQWAGFNRAIEGAPAIGKTYGDWIIGFYQEGAAILRAHEANVQAVVENARRPNKFPNKVMSIDENNLSELTVGLAANCPPHLASDVGHALANKSGTYGLCWYLDKNGKCKCSLRSNGDYDVSAIAKAFGGGGHKNAAGFEVDIQTLLEWRV